MPSGDGEGGNMIRIGILGYGNLGRGVEYAVEANPDMELVAVFTRRDPASVKPRTQVPVVAAHSSAPSPPTRASSILSPRTS